MFGSFFKLAKEAFNDWNEDKAPRLGAALAYYTVFSIAPLLIIVIAIAGMVFGQEAVHGQVSQTMEGMLGKTGATAIEEMIKGASKPSESIWATVFGTVLLLIGASGVFGQLQDALNTIWEVEPKPGRGILGMIKDRFFSFTMVLGTGFLLLVSLMLTAALGAVGDYVMGMKLPGGEFLWQVVNVLFSYVVVSAMFALIFKYVPDVKIAWRDVIVGALLTGVLFSVGKLALGLYLGKNDVTSSYGAVGSLVVVLIWIYYTSQILFFGAEFTQVFANAHGSRVVPTENARLVSQEKREQEGMGKKKDPKKAAPSGGASGGEKRSEPRQENIPGKPIYAFAGEPQINPLGEARDVAEPRPSAMKVVATGALLVLGVPRIMKAFVQR